MLKDVPVEAGYKILDRRWVLYDVLGQGGMAVVYRGKHVRMGHDVAIKCLDPVLARRDPQFVERFEKEARAAARVNDPCVVQVHDVAEASGLHFMAMQFVDGENARQRVERKGPLSVPEAITIATGAASGLAAAHKAGLVHRDVKPDNILISTTGEVKLADLGLAKMADGDSAMTMAGVTMGTPRYMPPEQFGDASTVGPAADVYSLGATLFFLLTGTDGIVGSSVPEVMKVVCDGRFPRATTIRPDVPAEIDALIATCVSVNSAARPADGSQLLAAIQSIDIGPRYSLADDGAEPTLLGVALVSPPPAATLMQIQQTIMVGGNAPGIAGPARGAGSIAAPPAQPGGVSGKTTQIRSAAEIADERLKDRQRLLDSRVGMSKKRSWALPVVAILVLLVGGAAAAHWKYPEYLAPYGVPPWPGTTELAGGADSSDAAKSANADEQIGKLGGSAVDAINDSRPNKGRRELDPVEPGAEVSELDPDSQPLDVDADALAGTGDLINEADGTELPLGGNTGEPTGTTTTPAPTLVQLESPQLSDGEVVTRDDLLHLTGQVPVGRSTLIVLDVDGSTSQHPIDTDGSFDIPMDVTPGARHAVGLSVDGSAPTSFIVAHDLILPVITVVSPVESARRTNATSIDVTLSVDDEHLASVTIDGDVIEPDASGNFTLAARPLPLDGKYTILIEALDVVGNQTLRELEIERDTVAPEHTSLTPEPGSRLVVGGQVEWVMVFDSEPASVHVGDVPLEIDGLEARGTLKLPVEKSTWSPILSVVDDLGNQRNSKLEYTLAGALPERAPEGFSVVDAVPGEGQNGQDAGPAADAGWAWRVKHDLTGLVFLRVEAGSFAMGSSSTETASLRDDLPQRDVTLSRAYYLAETEITQEQYALGGQGQVAADEGARQLPATAVSWKSATEFCDDNGFQLPTEAEWEYASRAGTTTPWNTGAGIDTESANIAPEGGALDGAQVMPVGSFSGNGWGFFDMHGNVAELCRDSFNGKYYKSAPDLDPFYQDTSSGVVMRGGSYQSPAETARSACRLRYSSRLRNRTLGFRPMRYVPEQ
jgi:hypothetical protein